MGNYRSRRPGFIQGWQIDVAQYTFQGLTDDEIIEKVFHWSQEKLTLEPEKAKSRLATYRQRMRNLRKDPKFIEYYKSIITEWTVHNVGRALNRIAAQVDDPEGYLANKAANDVLNRGMKLFEDEDANKLTIRVEGMPELGAPTPTADDTPAPGKD